MKSSHSSSELTSSAPVLFIPLGGLGEVGMNCFCLEQNDQILVVDCGITFPSDDIGVEVLHPRFDYLEKNADKIVGVFITHGHEDHIGALPYLLQILGRELQIFAPAHAATLLAGRLLLRQMSSEQICVVKIHELYRVGPFEVTPLPVSHSIIDATALAINTTEGMIVHTGDFDLDSVQPAGVPIQAADFESLGQRGVRLLLSDSTNIGRETRNGHEGDVAAALAEVILEASHRVLVTLFSSNAHRLKVLFEVARKTGRKVAILGRSLDRQLDALDALGVFDRPEDLLMRAEDLAKMPREKILLIAGGSQGEAASALRRISLGQHRHISLESGDRVIFSSRVIPGNEKSVFNMTNDLLRRGVEIRSSRTDEQIHVSGHASRSEQAQMLAWTQPESFIPVHGTLQHLRAHAELAISSGVHDICVVENGAVVAIRADQPLTQVDMIKAGRTFVGAGYLELDARTRRRRAELGRKGVLLLSGVINAEGSLEGKAQVSSLGIPRLDGNAQVLSVLLAQVKKSWPLQGGRARLEENLRSLLRKLVHELVSVRPQVQVHLLEAERVSSR